MRAIFIDAVNKKISEVEIDSGYKVIQKYVDGTFAVGMEFENADTVFVNDEGMINGTDAFFILDDARQPFAGNGLIVGTDYDSGESISAKTELDVIKAKTKFYSRAEIIKLMDQ